MTATFVPPFFYKVIISAKMHYRISSPKIFPISFKKAKKVLFWVNSNVQNQEIIILEVLQTCDICEWHVLQMVVSSLIRRR